MTLFRRLLILWFAAVLLLDAGCQTAASANARKASPYCSSRKCKPVVAVADFENLANKSGQWNLGSGMADVLVAELLETDRVIVLERKDIGDVLNEIVLQGKDLFRKEGKVERGKLKNAHYLISGSVTDFTETMESSGWFGISWLTIFGHGSRARVAITVKVSDVETGQIVSSVKAAKTVSAGGAGAEAKYKNVAFGGDAFFRTPLGKATESAIHQAVRHILRDLPTEYWQPRVAEGNSDVIVVNGGQNVRVRKGDQFLVREDEREITDPVTGNPIETVPGRIVGRIEVREVMPLSAHAVVIEGTAQRGQVLEPVRD